MKCWHCNTELIWGGDHDLEDENDEYAIVSNLSCPNCGSFVEVYLPKEPTNGKDLHSRQSTQDQGK